MLSKIRKGTKKIVEDKVRACEEVFCKAQNRLILGLIFIGLGSGLIASAYIHVPE